MRECCFLQVFELIEVENVREPLPASKECSYALGVLSVQMLALTEQLISGTGSAGRYGTALMIRSLIKRHLHWGLECTLLFIVRLCVYCTL